MLLDDDIFPLAGKDQYFGGLLDEGYFVEYHFNWFLSVVEGVGLAVFVDDCM